MTSARTYADYLEDILDATEKAMGFIQDMTREQFIGDDKTSFAVVRALEIVGEATKLIPHLRPAILDVLVQIREQNNRG